MQHIDRSLDFSENGRVHITKALLKAVGHHFGLSDFELYQRYCRAYELTHSEYNISGLKRLGRYEELIRRMSYGLDQPHLSPSHFSFFSHADVNRLARVVSSAGLMNFVKVDHDFVDVDLVSEAEEEEEDSIVLDLRPKSSAIKYDIVILWCSSLEAVDVDAQYLHDFRTMDANSPKRTNNQTLFFLVDKEHRFYSVRPMNNARNFCFLDFEWLKSTGSRRMPYFGQWTPEHRVAGITFGNQAAISLTNSLAQLLSLPMPPADSFLRSIDTMAQLDAASDDLAEFWRLNDPHHPTTYDLIIVTTFGRLNVSNCRNGRKTSRLSKLTVKKYLNAKHSYFPTLVCLGSKSAGHLAASASKASLSQFGKTRMSDLSVEEQATVRQALNRISVVCLFAGGKVLIPLADDYKLRVIDQVTQPQHFDKVAPLEFICPLYQDRKKLLGSKPGGKNIRIAGNVNNADNDYDSDTRWCSDNDFDLDDDDLEAEEAEESIFWNVSDDDSSLPRRDKSFKKHCTCKICLATDYHNNMSDRGPEKLLQFEWSVKDLLKMLGQDTPQHLAIIEQLLDMSVAAMDIESMTVKLSQETAEDGNFRYNVIESQVAVEDHPAFVQKPIMICHADWLSLLKQEEASNLDTAATSKTDQPNIQDIFLFPQEKFEVDRNQLLLLQASSDEDHVLYDFIRDYWRHVVHRYEAIKKFKQVLAAPLLAIVANYKKTHILAHATWTDKNSVFVDEAGNLKLNTQHPYIKDPDERKLVDSSWKYSLLGKFETKLEQLISEYTIFSFYG